MVDRLYSTIGLLGVLRARDKPTAWLRDRFFGNTPAMFNTAEIAFEKLKMRRKMAPFVSPRVAGKARRRRGRTMSTFEPAYVKPKNEVSPNENFVRLPGENLGGEMSPQQRFMANVTQTLYDQDDEITRREEWMCSQILQTGKVVVSGEDYPEVEVDFGRDAALTVALVTTSRWGETGVSPLNDLRTWATLVATKSGGTVTNVTMGAEAAAIFQKDADVRAILDNRRQADGRFQLGPVTTGSEDMVAAYLGSIGQFDFWQYTQKVELDDDTVVDLFPDYGVHLDAPGAFAGLMAYGAIQDNRVLRARRRWPSIWDEKDPSTTFLKTEAAPLPVPREVNGSFFATVR